LGGYRLTVDNVLADLTALSLEVLVVLLTIEHLIEADEVTAARERLRAMVADEVLRMVGPTKSFDDLPNNDSLTSATFRSSDGLEATAADHLVLQLLLLLLLLLLLQKNRVEPSTRSR